MRVLAPVVRIDAVADSDVTQILRGLQGTHLVGSVWFLIDRIGRTEQYRAHSQAAREEILGQVELEPHVASRDFADVGMREGVVADLVAFVVNAPSERGIVFGLQ